MTRKKSVPLIDSFDNIPDEALVPEKEQPYEIPSNWKWVTFQSLNCFNTVTINPSKCPEQKFELYSVPSLSDGFPELTSGTEIGSTKQIVAEGDVLVCKINPRINRVWTVMKPRGQQQIASLEWIVFRPSFGNADYFEQYFKSSAFRHLLTSRVSGVGGSLTRARPKDVALYPIPLPPLEEQKNIVGIMKEYLPKIDHAATRAQLLVDSSEELITALLRTAIEGNISRDWRTYHRTSRTEWTTFTFKELGSWGGGGTPKKSVKEYWSNGTIRWVTPKDMKGWIIGTTHDHVSAAGVADSSANLFRGPAICIVVRSGILRRALPTAVLYGEFTVNQDIKVLHSVDTAVNIEFLHYYLMAREAQIRMLASKSGTTVESIDFKKLMNLTIDLPSRDEQDVIVRRLKDLLASAERVAELADRASDTLARSRTSLLTAALGGKLNTSA